MALNFDIDLYKIDHAIITQVSTGTFVFSWFILDAGSIEPRKIYETEVNSVQEIRDAISHVLTFGEIVTNDFFYKEVKRRVYLSLT